ncbi:hypothetical protein C8R43DRAFT_957767 [Mycena crocata]|nr:hypothetical protein C8R43DRAFT_957767 [Mycena crocata]
MIWTNGAPITTFGVSATPTRSLVATGTVLQPQAGRSSAASSMSRSTVADTPLFPEGADMAIRDQQALDHFRMTVLSRDKLQEKHNQLKKRHDTCETKLQALRDTITAYEKRIQSLKGDGTEKQALQDTITAHQKNIERLKKECESKDERITELEEAEEQSLTFFENRRAAEIKQKLGGKRPRLESNRPAVFGFDYRHWTVVFVYFSCYLRFEEA